MMTSPSSEEGTAYHLDIVLTVVFDGRLAGVVVVEIKMSLSICVPLILSETSRL